MVTASTTTIDSILPDRATLTPRGVDSRVCGGALDTIVINCQGASRITHQDGAPADESVGASAKQLGRQPWLPPQQFAEISTPRRCWLGQQHQQRSRVSEGSMGAAPVEPMIPQQGLEGSGGVA